MLQKINSEEVILNLNINSYELHKSFFGDVFGRHILTKKTNVSHTWQKETFSKTLIDALVKNKPLGISHNNKFSKRTTVHIINVWGADFDENYNVVGLYITNSDDPKSTYKLKDDSKERLIECCVLQCLI
ncbi:IdeS/Mac family cysteine endopeptidase [Mycoplasmopsis cynos]|nr:IdeS/Mac family cysteine endopeptidase [Mycoplasmopsis cynos]